MLYSEHKRGLQVPILLSGDVCSVIMNFHTVRIPFVTFGIEPKAHMVSVGGGSRAHLQCNSPDWQVFTLSILLTLEWPEISQRAREDLIMGREPESCR